MDNRLSTFDIPGTLFWWVKLLTKYVGKKDKALDFIHASLYATKSSLSVTQVDFKNSSLKNVSLPRKLDEAIDPSLAS